MNHPFAAYDFSRYRKGGNVAIRIIKQCVRRYMIIRVYQYHMLLERSIARLPILVTFITCQSSRSVHQSAAASVNTNLGLRVVVKFWRG